MNTAILFAIAIFFSTRYLKVYKINSHWLCSSLHYLYMSSQDKQAASTTFTAPSFCRLGVLLFAQTPTQNTTNQKQRYEGENAHQAVAKVLSVKIQSHIARFLNVFLPINRGTYMYSLYVFFC